jgi:FkbM family methyltransferase
MKSLIANFFYKIVPFRIKKFIHFKFSEYINNSKNLESLIAGIRINNINFKLKLPKEINAHKTYMDDFKNGKIYEETMIFCLSSICKRIPDFTFLDLGSYVGYYSMFVARLTKDKNKIFSVESNKSYSLCIEESRIINKFFNLKVFNKIISHFSENIIVYNNTSILERNINKIIKESYSYDEKINNENILKNGTISKSISLDELCQNENIQPSIVKIDVHGAEGQVLLGGQNILSNYIKVILLELHPDEYLNKYSDGMRRIDVINLLIKNNFKTYIISPFRYSSRSLEYINFKNGKKLKFLEVNSSNFNEFFFDREIDVFILALSNNINIESFDCFS